MVNLSDKYPWISFSINMEKLSWKIWMRLGQCIAKCNQIKQSPLTPEARTRLHRIYLAKGAHATTAIEGNTLTEQDAEKIIEGRLELPKFKEYLKNEIQNIIDACNDIGYKISQGRFEQKITVKQICEYNKIVLRGVPYADEVEPGTLRKHYVSAGNYRAPDPADLTELLERFCQWMNNPSFKDEKESDVLLSIIKAIIAHLYIAMIHPFGDGNGRTARLLEFAILLNAGLPSPAAHLLSNHYNNTRALYYNHLSKATKKRDAILFVSYAIEGFLDQLDEQLKEISNQLVNVYWRNYIYDQFRTESHKKMMRRRRELVLALSEQDDFVEANFLKALMSEYYENTVTTFSRDIKALVERKFIIQEHSKFSANKQLVLQWLPFSAP
jgi:Fic family protein